SSGGQFVDPTGNAFAVVNAVIEKAGFSHRYEDSQLPIATGYSDVTADTVVRYANFPNLYVPGLKNIISVQGPIQTLLLAYNKDGVYGKPGPMEVVFPRAVVQILLNTQLSDLNVCWSDWDPELSDNVIFANRRENSSGTRLSQYVGIQRFVPSKKFIFI